jgi:hypothetical protein
MQSINPHIDLDEVAARYDLSRAAFKSDWEFLRCLHTRLGHHVEDLQHQVHLRESEHAVAFYALRALEKDADAKADGLPHGRDADQHHTIPH